MIIFLIVSISFNAILFLSRNNTDRNNSNNEAFVESNSDSINLIPVNTVTAEEIYPLFECSCCGKAIDQCTCPMARERRNYVDALIELSDNKPKDEIVLFYVKKYGLNSFLDKEKQQEFREKLIKEAPVDRPIITFIPESYDFGNISQKEEITTTTFEVKNDGDKDLIIDKIETSCGCTSASIVYQGEEGPKFSMPGHGINEKNKDWQIKIGPNQKAQLKVYYDPHAHKDFRGTAIREISIFSNDPIDFEKKVQIELNQID